MILRGHFFLKKKGTFSRNEKGSSSFIAKSWGHVPPVPTSIIRSIVNCKLDLFKSHLFLLSILLISIVNCKLDLFKSHLFLLSILAIKTRKENGTEGDGEGTAEENEMKVSSLLLLHLFLVHSSAAPFISSQSTAERM